MIISSQQLKQTWWTTWNTFNKKLTYHLKHGKLFKIVKSIYSTKHPSTLTDEEHLYIWSLMYRPSYLSYETILHQAGIIFQYDTTLTFAWPYTTQKYIWKHIYTFRRLPMWLLTLPLGTIRKAEIIQATPERAICDTLYQNPHFPFDHIPTSLNKDLLLQLAEIYAHTRGQKHLPQIALSLIS